MLVISLWGGALRLLPFPKEIIWGFIFVTLLSSLFGMFLVLLAKKNKININTFGYYLLILIFCIWSITTLTWSPIDKSLLVTNDITIFTNALIPSIALCLASSSNSGLAKNWIMGLILVTSLLFFYLLLMRITSSVSSYEMLLEMTDDGSGGNYLVTSVGISAFFVLLFLRGFFIKKYRIFLFLLAAIAFWLALDLGGRGPVIGSILAISTFFLFQAYRRFSLLPFLIVCSIFISPLIYGGLFLFNNLDILSSAIPFLMRLEADIVSNDLNELSSIGQRLIWIQLSIDLISQSPIFGHGLFSWRSLAGLPYGEIYPHNLVLDILVDLGVIGMIIFLPILILSVKSALKILVSSDSFYENACAALFIYFLSMEFISGYIFSSWIWPWMIVIFIVHSNSNKVKI